MPTDTTAWELVLIQLQIILSKYDFENWFTQTKQMSFEGRILTVGTPSQFFANWLEEHYADKIENAKNKVSDPVISEVNFVVCEELSKLAEMRTIAKTLLPSTEQPQQELEFCKPKRARGGAYVVHPGNEEAHRTGMFIAKSPPGRHFPILFLIGEPGIGKTALMHAIRREFWLNAKNKPDFRSEFFTMKHYTAQFVNGTHNHKKESMDWINSLERCGLLCIDDINLIGRGPGTQENLFNLIKNLVEPEDPKKPIGQVIITMNCTLPELQSRLLEQSMVSILNKGTVEILTPPDESTRVEIMKSMIFNWDPGIQIADEAFELIAHHTEDGDGRKLEGILLQARSYALQDHGIIDGEVIGKIIAKRLGHSPSLPKKKLTFDMVIEAITTYYRLREGDIKGRSRNGPIVLARQLAMWLCDKHTDLTSKEMERKFNKERTTIGYSITAITKKMEEDPILAENVTAIELRLGLIPSIK